MNTITVQDLHEKLQQPDAKQSMVVIDVRTPEEYAEGHIPTAKSRPLDKIELYVDALKNYDVVYAHCKTGGRSSAACIKLEAFGLDHVINIEGGITAWMAAGYEAEV